MNLQHSLKINAMSMNRFCIVNCGFIHKSQLLDKNSLAHLLVVVYIGGWRVHSISIEKNSSEMKFYHHVISHYTDGSPPIVEFGLYFFQSWPYFVFMSRWNVFSVSFKSNICFHSDFVECRLPLLHTHAAIFSQIFE